MVHLASVKALLSTWVSVHCAQRQTVNLAGALGKTVECTSKYILVDRMDSWAVC